MRWRTAEALRSQTPRRRRAPARASSRANPAPTSPNTAPSPSVLASSAASIASGRENATANFSRPSAPDVALAHSAPSSAGSSVLPNSASTAPTATPIGRATTHGTIRLEQRRHRAAVRACEMDGLPKTRVRSNRNHQPTGRFSGWYAPSGEPHSAGSSIASRYRTRRTQAAIRGRACLMRPTAADQSRESPAMGRGTVTKKLGSLSAPELQVLGRGGRI